jgi:aspartate aminotransferase
MHYLSDRVMRLEESATIAMARISRELTEQGHDIISLSLGEPDFVTPKNICDAAVRALDEGYTHYPPISGYRDLRQAIAAKFKRDNNLDFTYEQIVVSTGAKQSIANTVLCIINPGDEVIIPAPYWVSYSQVIEMAGGKPVYVQTSVETEFKATAEQIKAAITPKTKMLIYSSPCNPTGSMYSKEELKAIAEVIAPHERIYVVSDEIYEHIAFEFKHESIAQFDILKDRVVVINGVSKGFAMTGWRIGYIGAPLEIAKACDKMQGQFTSGASSIAQRAALEAVKTDWAVYEFMKESFLRRRDLVLELLKEIPGLRYNKPHGAFYIFPDVSSYFGKSDGTSVINNATELCTFLLKDAKVSVVTGEAFGDEGCVRLSYATSDEKLKEALKRLKESLAKLK